jgi:peptidoglycan/LPS O-acetylase OafA/YrhL
MRQDHDLAGIEALRFVCGFAILLWHYQHFLFSGEYIAAVAEEARPTFPLYQFFLPAYNYGNVAVQIFWVISGFIFYRQYAMSIKDRKVPFVFFAVRRFSRLYPLHLVTLLFVAGGQIIYVSSHGQPFIYSDNEPLSFLKQLFFATSWFGAQSYSFNGPIWSVSAEMLIYAAFFAAARLSRGVIMALLAFSAIWVVNYEHLAPFLNQSVLDCGMFFFAGVVAEWLSRRRFSLPVSAAIATATLTLLTFHIYALNFRSLLLLSISCVVLFSRLDTTKAAATVRSISFLGNATYSSYLIHFPLQLAAVIVVDYFGIRRVIFFNPFALILYLASVIMGALAVYHYFERPAQEWIRARFARSEGQSAYWH